MNVVWTMGDPNGVGPEIILKSFEEISDSQHQVVVVGSRKILEESSTYFGINIELNSLEESSVCQMINKEGRYPKSVMHVVDVIESKNISIEFGKVTQLAGEISIASIEAGIRMCRSKLIDAMVTAPINKQAIKMSRCGYLGHTDLLNAHFSSLGGEAQMLFYDPLSHLKIALATIHLPFTDVVEELYRKRLSDFIVKLVKNIQKSFAISNLKAAVLGLNPHASDAGVIGNEEQTFLKLELESAKMFCDIEGFFPADSYFGSGLYKNFDVTIALYHDQGLIPFKMLAFDTGVNVTLGLPIVRTSPDHGVAFDIAGKGIASPKSFLAAHWAALSIAECSKCHKF